jgi:hypothetical protein
VYNSLDGVCAPSVHSGTMHLSDYMAELHLGDEDVAGAIGRSRVSVSRYRRRLVRPDWEAIEAIKNWSNQRVTADDWLDAPPVAAGQDDDTEARERVG